MMGKRNRQRFALDSSVSSHYESVLGNSLALGNAAAESERSRHETSSLGQKADKAERQAAKDPFTAGILNAMKQRDDRLRALSICCICGGKALYYIGKKRYCKKDVGIGQAEEKKRLTPRAK